MMAPAHRDNRKWVSRLLVGLGALAVSFGLAFSFVQPAFAAPEDAATDVVNRLQAVAGKDAEVTFAFGGSEQQPAYTWVFNGRDLPREQAAKLTSLDLTIEVSTADTNSDGAPDALFLDFAHKGALPLPAIVNVYLPSTMEIKRSELSLYAFDDATGGFLQRQSGLSVEGAYVSFTLTHCSRWAVSSLDLAAPIGVEVVPSYEAPASAASFALGTLAPTTGEPQGALLEVATPWLVLAALLCFCALVLLLVMRARRKAEVVIMERGWHRDVLDFGDIPSLAELMEIEIEEPVER